MKHKIVSILFPAAVLLLNLACQSYQLGGTMEPREHANAFGGFFAAESNKYVENSLFYIHDMYPGTTVMSGAGIGYDFSVKIPIDFAKDRLSLFPMASIEGRYIQNNEDDLDFSDSFGLGVKFGGGLDINFSRFFYLRGKVQYQPGITSWMDSYPGFRYGLALGYRTASDPIRSSITRTRNTQQRDRLARQAAQERELAAQEQARLARQAELDRETAFQQAIAAEPNNPQLYYERGHYFFTNERIIPASALWERTLELDSNYRVSSSLRWTSNIASGFGVQTSGNIDFSNFSLNLHLAILHRDSATGTGNDPEKVVPEADKRATLEKALAAFRRGYEIDITGGRNTNRNLQTVYLGYIAHTLDLLGRTQEASAAFVELSRVANVTPNIRFRATTAAPNIESYYVSASGNNNNDGLSESRPLRSLALAYERAAAGNIKRIMVIGRLNQQSEGEGDDNYVFRLSNPDGVTDRREILITGKWGAERAVLSGAGSRKGVVDVFSTPTRFEYIEISGGELNAENEGGVGINLFQTGIIGTGTIVRANKGAGVRNARGSGILAGGEIRDNEGHGVFLSFGTFTMQSGTINNNRSVQGGGGVFILTGTFIMQSGTISNNRSVQDGGGVLIRLGTFSMSGGTISSNTARRGGGIYCSFNSTFSMSNGTISGNTATEDGGGVYVFSSIGENTTSFTMTGGNIRNNTAQSYGGGVYISGVREDLVGTLNGGVFRQSGGTICGNRARLGGGVFVMRHNGRYDRTGGTVTGNTTTHISSEAMPLSNDNVMRIQGALGSGW